MSHIPPSADGSVGIKKQKKSQNSSMSPFMGNTHTQWDYKHMSPCPVVLGIELGFNFVCKISV